jgi:hypothetical protein
MVTGRGDTPKHHDILTGSQPDGRAWTGPDELGEDMTCHNWTSRGAGTSLESAEHGASLVLPAG